MNPLLAVVYAITHCEHEQEHQVVFVNEGGVSALLTLCKFCGARRQAPQIGVDHGAPSRWIRPELVNQLAAFSSAPHVTADDSPLTRTEFRELLEDLGHGVDWFRRTLSALNKAAESEPPEGVKDALDSLTRVSRLDDQHQKARDFLLGLAVGLYSRLRRLEIHTG